MTSLPVNCFRGRSCGCVFFSSDAGALKQRRLEQAVKNDVQFLIDADWVIAAQGGASIFAEGLRD